MTYTPSKEQVDIAAQAVAEALGWVPDDLALDTARVAALAALGAVGPAIASNTLEAYANGLEDLQDLAGTPDFEWIVASMRLKAQNYLEEFDE